MKTCSKCKKTLSLDMFSKRKISNDGYQPYCKKCSTVNRAAWTARNPERSKELNRSWKKANPEKDKTNSNAWKKANPEKHRAWFSTYKKRRAVEEPLFKLRQQVSSLLKSAFKNSSYTKNTKTATLLGTDFITFRNHLIRTARSNYGGKYYPNRPYQIDHIIPCASAKTEIEFVKLQHYSNLQLLSPKHNKEKSDSLSWKIPPLKNCILVESCCGN